MSVKIWIGENDVENTNEAKMLAEVIKDLRARLDTVKGDFHVLCNFLIPGYRKKYDSRLAIPFARSRR